MSILTVCENVAADVKQILRPLSCATPLPPPTWALHVHFGSRRFVSLAEFGARVHRGGVAASADAAVAFARFAAGVGVVAVQSRHPLASPPAPLTFNANVMMPVDPLPDTQSQLWTHNETTCFWCGEKFTMFRRQHHCRCCQHAYCDAHSMQRRALSYVSARLRESSCRST